MMRTFLIILVVSLSALVLSSCGSRIEAQKQCQIRVGIVFDIGGKNDRELSFRSIPGLAKLNAVNPH